MTKIGDNKPGFRYRTIRQMRHTDPAEREYAKVYNGGHEYGSEKKAK
jgi:hypothetical protein